MRYFFLCLLVLLTPCSAYSFGMTTGTDITIINGELFINGVFIPKNGLIPPEAVLRATIQGKNKAAKHASNVVNSCNIINSEITPGGLIRKKRFSAMDGSKYRAVKRFTVRRPDGSNSLGASTKRSGSVRVHNKVTIINSRVDEYDENIGTTVKSRRLVRGKVTNDVNVIQSQVGVR